MTSSFKAFKGLLIVLVSLTILAALFVGGCGAFGVFVYLKSIIRGIQDRYGIPEALGLIGAFAVPLAGLVLGANVFLMRTLLLRRDGRLSCAVLTAVAVTDILGALGAWMWIAWFGFLDPWYLTRLGAGLLALKGLGVGVLAIAHRSWVSAAGPDST